MRLSLVIRRVHMYLALLLTPWLAMYAASTLVMNHREHLKADSSDARPEFQQVSSRSYPISWAPTTTPQQMAEQILRDLALEGRHNVQVAEGPPRKLTIVRHAPAGQLRVTYLPDQEQLTVEREPFASQVFLERFHRRRGYDTPWLLEDLWSLSVDLVIGAMVFWALSGLWLWWELRATRVWGSFALVSGLILFAAFLWKI